jgi:hypothetical protein
MARPSEPQAAGSAKVVVSAQPAASAPQALSLRAVAAEVGCVQAARLWEAAAESDARGRPPEAAVPAAASAAEPQQVAVGAVAPVAVLRPEEAAAEVRAVAARQPAVAAEPVWDAEVRRLVAEVVGPLVPPPVPWAQRPAAERPALAAWACRPGLSLPWPGPRPAVRTAHAMWRSRAALPSKLLWQAARCEGLS